MTCNMYFRVVGHPSVYTCTHQALFSSNVPQGGSNVCHAPTALSGKRPGPRRAFVSRIQGYDVSVCFYIDALVLLRQWAEVMLGGL